MEPIGSARTTEVSGIENVLPLRRSGTEAGPAKTWKKPPADGTLENGKAGNADPPIDKERIERIADAMDSYVKSIQRDLDIRVDKDTGKFIVKVLSRETGKVIREIPPEEILELASRMEEMAGVLVNKSA